VRYSVDAAITLGRYTAVTFDATGRDAFVAGVAALGAVDPSRVEIISVSDMLSAPRRSLLQTIAVNVDFKVSFEEFPQATSTMVALDAAVAEGGLQHQLRVQGMTALTSTTLLRAPVQSHILEHYGYRS